MWDDIMSTLGANRVEKEDLDNKVKEVKEFHKKGLERDNFIKEFADKVLDRLEEKQMTIKDLADKLGMKESRLLNVLTRDKDIELTMVCDIANAIDMHIVLSLEDCNNNPLT